MFGGFFNRVSKRIQATRDENASADRDDDEALVERAIPMRTFAAEYLDVLDDIAHNGVVYFVELPRSDTNRVPQGMVDPNGAAKFVIGPPSICGRVMGLVDEEYGWPTRVDLEVIQDVNELVPGRRCHPMVYRNGKCIAFAIMIQEYAEIRERG